jgi:hypothetical protein
VGINGKDIESSTIMIDMDIAEILRKIWNHLLTTLLKKQKNLQVN